MLEARFAVFLVSALTTALLLATPSHGFVQVTGFKHQLASASAPTQLCRSMHAHAKREGLGVALHACLQPTRSPRLVREMTLGAGVAALAAVVLLLTASPGASWAQEDSEMELAPPILDQARTLTTKKSARLEKSLDAFEEETGFRILVLSEDPQTLNKSPKELKQMWALPDPDAVLVLVRPGSGNILAFNYGTNIGKLLPDRFFGELTGRFGNMYNVKDVGEDGVVEETVNILETCLRREKGCFAVPGIGKDQYSATFASSIAGGVFFGFSALTGAQFIAKKDATKEDAIFKFAPLLFSPLWGTFFIGLGLNPLLQREADIQLILQNIGAFGAAAAATGFIYPKLLGVWSGYL